MTRPARLTWLSMIAVAACAAGAPRVASAQATPYLGQIMTVPYNFCPIGWLETLGQVLPITQNTALFALLGTTYGGDGVRTFALPYLPPSTLEGGSVVRHCIALTGVFPSRS